jgi:hypothetical protein
LDKAKLEQNRKNGWLGLGKQQEDILISAGILEQTLGARTE